MAFARSCASTPRSRRISVDRWLADDRLCYGGIHATRGNATTVTDRIAACTAAALPLRRSKSDFRSHTTIVTFGLEPARVWLSFGNRRSPFLHRRTRQFDGGRPLQFLGKRQIQRTGEGQSVQRRHSLEENSKLALHVRPPKFIVTVQTTSHSSNEIRTPLEESLDESTSR
jgi:hypothetical protein